MVRLCQSVGSGTLRTFSARCHFLRGKPDADGTSRPMFPVGALEAMPRGPADAEKTMQPLSVSQPTFDKTSTRNRGWTVTFAGMGINLALGVLYTWSMFKG